MLIHSADGTQGPTNSMTSLKLQCVSDKSQLISVNSYGMFFPEKSSSSGKKKKAAQSDVLMCMTLLSLLVLMIKTGW